MSDKQDITQTENGPVGGTKKRSCARHCKRWWWVHLIILIVITVIVVPVILLVAVPKIAQDKVNHAKLEIQGVNILETEGDSYLMEINSTITTDGKIKAKIDSFEGVMYLEDTEDQTPFASLEFPETNGNKHQLVNVSQRVEITDLAAFTRFNIWFHNNETVRVTVSGRTKVKPSGLTRKYGVDFIKTVTLNGLNHFDGTEVTDGHISLDSDADRNFNGTANIPNASVFTLDNGNVTFINYVGDEEVGTLYIDNMVLKPGDNIVNITATMDQAKILGAARQRPYCETGVVPFKLLGKSVINHGENLTYFAAALASANQTVEIDIGAILKKDLDYEISCSSNSDD
ncbi:hypothetical protein ACJ41O_002649 [Fusarium nematophilum]